MGENEEKRRQNKLRARVGQVESGKWWRGEEGKREELQSAKFT